MTTQPLQTPQQLIFKYRYERILGEGSNGKTYLAKSLNTDEYVAIKALKLNQSENFKSFELFKREAETLSSLHVPGVPRFYESILSEDLGGECYIIQEYISAPSIQSYLQEGRVFSEEETLIIMQKTAEILDILHTKYSPPVIHRDIKPSNILCKLPQNADPMAWKALRLYLIDFGAVANAHSNSDKSTIAGTVGYMAPEQNFGECLPQTDLYALGATALHMLTGVPPYDMEYRTYALDYNKALDEHAPKTSQNMRELLGNLLNYAHDKRPASASAVLDIIKSLQQGHSLVENKRKQNPILSAILRLLNLPSFRTTPRCEKFFNALNNPEVENVTLVCVPGTVQCLADAQTLEYTFFAKGQSWSGLTEYPVHKLKFNTNPKKLAEEYQELKNLQLQWLEPKDPIKLPANCLVVYHPKDPSFNKIFLFDENSAISSEAE